MSTTKTAPHEPETKPVADETASVIDTSKMNEGQRAALEMTEAARDGASEKGSFAGGLFMGRCDLSRAFPFPEQNPTDKDQGDAFLQRLEKFLKEKVNPDEIDRTGEIPQAVMDELAKLGAFGIKISPAYGGLGLSQQASPFGAVTITPPLPPSALTAAITVSAAACGLSPASRTRAQIWCATPSRMKNSPAPVAETAQARSSA